MQIENSTPLSIEKLVIALYAKGWGFRMSRMNFVRFTRSTCQVRLSLSSRTKLPMLPPTGRTVLWRALTWLSEWTVSYVREPGKVINKTVHLCIELNAMGYKEVLGMWVGKTGSSSFWMSTLTDLKARGMEDILITVSITWTALPIPSAPSFLSRPPRLRCASDPQLL